MNSGRLVCLSYKLVCLPLPPLRRPFGSRGTFCCSSGWPGLEQVQIHTRFSKVRTVACDGPNHGGFTLKYSHLGSCLSFRGNLSKFSGIRHLNTFFLVTHYIMTLPSPGSCFLDGTVWQYSLFFVYVYLSLFLGVIFGTWTSCSITWVIFQPSKIFFTQEYRHEIFGIIAFRRSFVIALSSRLTRLFCCSTNGRCHGSIPPRVLAV